MRSGWSWKWVNYLSLLEYFPLGIPDTRVKAKRTKTLIEMMTMTTVFDNSYRHSRLFVTSTTTFLRRQRRGRREGQGEGRQRQGEGEGCEICQLRRHPFPSISNPRHANRSAFLISCISPHYRSLQWTADKRCGCIVLFQTVDSKRKEPVARYRWSTPQ